MEIARWRFGESSGFVVNGFVVKDYTGTEKGTDPVVMVLKASDIFEFIADAAQRKAKVSVYAIGQCILDWS